MTDITLRGIHLYVPHVQTQGQWNWIGLFIVHPIHLPSRSITIGKYGRYVNQKEYKVGARLARVALRFIHVDWWLMWSEVPYAVLSIPTRGKINYIEYF